MGGRAAQGSPACRGHRSRLLHFPALFVVMSLHFLKKPISKFAVFALGCQLFQLGHRRSKGGVFCVVVPLSSGPRPLGSSACHLGRARARVSGAVCWRWVLSPLFTGDGGVAPSVLNINLCVWLRGEARPLFLNKPGKSRCGTGLSDPRISVLHTPFLSVSWAPPRC